MKTKVVNVHKQMYDVCIMRPGIYQNPYVIGVHGTQEEVVEKFRVYFRERIHRDMIYLTAVGELKGKRLGCCHDSKPCHGDIYVEFLEREGEWSEFERNKNDSR